MSNVTLGAHSHHFCADLEVSCDVDAMWLLDCIAHVQKVGGARLYLEPT